MNPTEVIVTTVNAPVVRSISHSPIRNHELLQEVVQTRHELSKQQCEQQHYISSLRYQLEKETQKAVHTANAEKYHFTYEIRGLEEQKEAKARMRCDDEERMVVRRKCFDNEIATLMKNFDQNVALTKD